MTDHETPSYILHPGAGWYYAVLPPRIGWLMSATAPAPPAAAAPTASATETGSAAPANRAFAAATAADARHGRRLRRIA